MVASAVAHDFSYWTTASRTYRRRQLLLLHLCKVVVLLLLFTVLLCAAMCDSRRGTSLGVTLYPSYMATKMMPNCANW